jgi:polysaccharide biosynthesis protein PelF
MKIAMVTEGTYPVITGGVSTWCDQLVRGLPEHDFSVVALTASGRERPVWEFPSNVTDLKMFPMWAKLPSPLRSRSKRRTWQRVSGHALERLWTAALGPDNEQAAEEFSAALKDLDEVSRQVGLARVLASEGSVHAILEAWRLHQDEHELPLLHVADAVDAATLADRTLAVIDSATADDGADLVHASGNGPSALVALIRKWRFGTPLMLTEHGVYLRERYIALHDAGYSWQVRRIVMAFLRILCRVVYSESDVILPVNRFNGRWEKHLGAAPEKVQTIPNGVDPVLYPPVVDEPEVPTISFVGRIDPLKDLETLIAAFAIVQREIPEARLRLFGPVPAGNEPYRDRLVAQAEQLGIAGSVSWEGRCDGSRPAIEAGHVVALSSVSEGLPFSVIEAMMCGRATVSTEVGGVSECYDDDQHTGMLVPARAPEAFAEACLRLLKDPDLRQAMGKAARLRALEVFTLNAFLSNYAEAYDTVAGAKQHEPAPVREEPLLSSRGRHAAPRRRAIELLQTGRMAPL